MWIDPDMSTLTSAVSEPRVSLRERKYAKTKLALMHATVERLRQKSFADVTVKEVCEEAEISEATFFNYFPKKPDVLVYFIRIWMVQVSLAAGRAAGPDAGLATLEAIFRITGDQIDEKPRVMQEIIAYMALSPDECVRQRGEELTPAELQLEFPEEENAAEIDTTGGLDGLFRAKLERAVSLGELPANTDVDVAAHSLIALFFGVPLGMVARRREGQPAVVTAGFREAYDAQLAILWAGLRARYG